MKQSSNETIFYLVRHGEAEQNVRHILSSHDNGEQFGLTEAGKSQAEAVARELADESIGIIFSSPLRRTRETAEAIAAATGAQIILDDRLRETDFGVFSGRSTSELWAKYPEPITRLEGNEEERLEGFRAMRTRLESFLADIPEAYRGERIVIVSHGDPIEILHGILSGVTLEASVSGWSPRVGSWVKVVPSLGK